MPYIKPELRDMFDQKIEELAKALGLGVNDEIFMSMCGDINYCVSTLIVKLMDKPSYAKIAMITGVLENIKQEFYRRAATPYEDDKIVQNGDIKAYRRLQN